MGMKVSRTISANERADSRLQIRKERNREPSGKMTIKYSLQHKCTLEIKQSSRGATVQKYSWDVGAGSVIELSHACSPVFAVFSDGTGLVDGLVDGLAGVLF